MPEKMTHFNNQSVTITQNFDSWGTRFYSLPTDAQNVLCFIAIYTAPLQVTRLNELCGSLGKQPDVTYGNQSRFYPGTLLKNAWALPRLKTALERLHKDEFIERPHGYAVCKQPLREQIVHHLVRSGQYKTFSDIIHSLTGGQFYTSSYVIRSYQRLKLPEDHIRESRHNLIVGDGGSVITFFRDFLYDQNNPKFTQTVLALFDGPDNWLQDAAPEIQANFLQLMLVQALSNLQPISPAHWTLLLDAVNLAKCDPCTQILFLDYALCTGRFEEIQSVELYGMPTLLRDAHQAFLSGDYERAAALYHKIRGHVPGVKNNRNTPLPCLLGIFSTLCDLHLGKTAQVQNIVGGVMNRKSNPRELLTFPLHISNAWVILQAIVSKLDGQVPIRLDLKTLGPATLSANWLSLLCLGYESIWLMHEERGELPTKLLALAEQAQTTFPWIAAEAAELAIALGAEKSQVEEIQKTTEAFRKSSNSVSLSKLITPKADWEICLDSLLSVTETKTEQPKQSGETKEKSTRLVWRASFSDNRAWFIPYEQTFSARTQSWLLGRPMALNRLHESLNTLDFLTDQDRKVGSHIKPYQYGSYHKKTEYRLDKEAIRDMVGHPLIFLGFDPKVRVELIQAKPEIIVSKKGDSIRVSFFPPLMFKKVSGTVVDDAEADLFVFEETKILYKVISLSKKEQKIRKILGHAGKVFPLKAESDLTAMIGNLVGDMTVKSDAKIEFENVPEVPAETKLYLHLAPSGEGLQVEFFVRPLGATGPSHRPGSGSERIIGEVDGRNLQAIRNLKGESQHRDEIVARYPAFATASASSKDQYVFETANDALSLLSELEDYKNGISAESETTKGKKRSIQSDDLEILWYQGGNISVSSSASFGNLNLSFSSAGEWLAASGTLKIDQETFDLQKILDMLDDNSDSRFIKISDRKFIALTNEFRKRLGDLKRLSQSKGKKIQLHPLAAMGLEEFFDAVPSLQKSTVWKNVRERIEKTRNFKPVFPKDFCGDMRDYQIEGFHWLARCAEWGVGSCLADDMGLGKTIQALALLLQRASKGPALVVAPTSVCFNWVREAERFAPTLNIKRVQSIGPGNIATKTDRDNLILSSGKRDIVVTSYTLLQQEIELFAQVGFSTVILDEAQAIKNPESNRAKAASRLQADFRLAMTGTPIENNLVELWSLFRFLNPGLLGSQKSFEDRFAVPIQRDHAAGPRNTLRRLMQPLILRRTKSQVLEELPPRTEIIREIEMSREEAALYEAARISALSDLENAKEGSSGPGHIQVFAALTRLRQLCCNPRLVLPNSNVESSKLEAFREIMQELKENRHKVLVFSQFVKHLEILRAELDEMGLSYQYLDGSTPALERQKRVDAFQSGDYDAFLISIKAGGSGLNLTAADYVIHMDPWWNPAVEDQATDRTHRIGQTRPVTVYRLITQGTIEEKIVRLHHAKRDIADKLLEGTDQATKLTADELIEILRS